MSTAILQDVQPQTLISWRYDVFKPFVKEPAHNTDIAHLVIPDNVTYFEFEKRPHHHDGAPQKISKTYFPDAILLSDEEAEVHLQKWERDGLIDLFYTNKSGQLFIARDGLVREFDEDHNAIVKQIDNRWVQVYPMPEAL